GIGGDGAVVVVRAAGGAGWRRASDGDVEGILGDRPRYDDWSLPQGEGDPGENDGQGALREVRGEAGIEARIRPGVAATTLPGPKRQTEVGPVLGHDRRRRRRGRRQRGRRSDLGVAARGAEPPHLPPGRGRAGRPGGGGGGVGPRAGDSRSPAVPSWGRPAS